VVVVVGSESEGFKLGVPVVVAGAFVVVVVIVAPVARIGSRTRHARRYKMHAGIRDDDALTHIRVIEWPANKKQSVAIVGFSSLLFTESHL